MEVFKVWPTFRDRENYQLAMAAVTLDELREQFPSSFTQSGTLRKIGFDHPPALEAIWYFAEEVHDWISQPSVGGSVPLLTALADAILRDLRLVSISLGEEDDAQVIFETLNGRGAQLRATDLIRNFIFMRADRESAPASELFENYWSPFEEEFWTEAQRRGRLLNPRLEWFIQTALQAVAGDEVEIGRLYAAYKRFSLGNGAQQQLIILEGHGENYKRLVSGIGSEPIAQFGGRVASWEASTAHALALLIAISNSSNDAKTKAFNAITSYFVRRAICGLTAKNYNKIFLQLIKRLSTSAFTPESLLAALAGLEGDASRWPRDEEFRKAWVNEPVYPGRLDAPRMKAVLAEIEIAMRSQRSEEPFPGGLGNLDIDHILPTSWFENWPLPDGTKAQAAEAEGAKSVILAGGELSERQLAIQGREESKATIGNLTLLHFGVNRSLQNSEFATKRERLFKESNLHLNRELMRLQEWNETGIMTRGQSLFEIAVKLWPGQG